MGQNMESMLHSGHDHDFWLQKWQCQSSNVPESMALHLGGFVLQEAFGSVQGHFCSSWLGLGTLLLASNTLRAGMLLNILQDRGQPPPPRIIWLQMSIASRLKIFAIEHLLMWMLSTYLLWVPLYFFFNNIFRGKFSNFLYTHKYIHMIYIHSSQIWHFLSLINTPNPVFELQCCPEWQRLSPHPMKEHLWLHLGFMVTSMIYKQNTWWKLHWESVVMLFFFLLSLFLLDPQFICPKIKSK